MRSESRSESDQVGEGSSEKHSNNGRLGHHNGLYVHDRKRRTCNGDSRLVRESCVDMKPAHVGSRQSLWISSEADAKGTIRATAATEAENWSNLLAARPNQVARTRRHKSRALAVVGMPCQPQVKDGSGSLLQQRKRKQNCEHLRSNNRRAVEIIKIDKEIRPGPANRSRICDRAKINDCGAE